MANEGLPIGSNYFSACHACSKTAVEEELKGIDDDAKHSLQQAQELPTVRICKHL